MRRDTGTPAPHPVSVWLVAARPRTLPAAFAPVLIGTALAFGDGGLHWPSALVALACAVLIQIATNFANDLFDFQRGADTDARQGPLRVTQAGLATPAMMKRAIVAVLVLASRRCRPCVASSRTRVRH